MTDIRKQFTENAEQFDALVVKMLAENDALHAKVDTITKTIRLHITDLGKTAQVLEEANFLHSALEVSKACSELNAVVEGSGQPRKVYAWATHSIGESDILFLTTPEQVERAKAMPGIVITPLYADPKEPI